MELHVAVELIRAGVEPTGVQSWADLGAGSGLFTGALAEVLSTGSTIYAVDKNDTFQQRYLQSGQNIISLEADFEKDNLNFSNLDGLLMANSLHFVKDKISLLSRLKDKLSSEGRMILVEYDLRNTNPWVPYPVPFIELTDLIKKVGFKQVRKLHEVASAFNRANIYSAVVSA